MIQFALVAAASFVYVAAKAFQQLNVVYDVRWAVPPCTAVMAACEIGLVGNIAVEAVAGGWLGLGLTFAAMTIGSTGGCLLSMEVHRAMRRRG